MRINRQREPKRWIAYRTRLLDSLMKLAILSSYVRGPGAKPVSVLLVGEPSVGKSTAIRRVRNVKGVFSVDSFTQKSLEGILVSEGFESGEHSVIAISDLNDILSKPSSVSAPALGVLKSLADEGILHRTAGQYTPHGTDSKAAGSGVRFAEPVMAGFIAAITKSDLHYNYQQLHSGGLLDRPLTIELDATKKERMLMAMITVSETDPRQPVPWKLSRVQPATITMSKTMVHEVHKWTENDLHGSCLFRWCDPGSTRLHVNLCNLARANALISKRKHVAAEDIEAVKKLEPLFMRGYMPIEEEEETASTKPRKVGKVGRPAGSKDKVKRVRKYKKKPEDKHYKLPGDNDYDR